jgi:chromosome partitioning protein
LATIIASEAIRHGQTVTLIEADPNGHLGDWYDRGNCPPEIQSVFDEDPTGEKSLDEIVAGTARSNIVITDTEGTANTRADLVCQAAHLVVIPLHFSELDLRGAVAMSRLERVTGNIIPHTLVPNRISSASTTTDERQIRGAIEQTDLALCDPRVLEKAIDALRENLMIKLAVILLPLHSALALFDAWLGTRGALSGSAFLLIAAIVIFSMIHNWTNSYQYDDLHTPAKSIWQAGDLVGAYIVAAAHPYLALAQTTPGNYQTAHGFNAAVVLNKDQCTTMLFLGLGISLRPSTLAWHASLGELDCPALVHRPSDRYPQGRSARIKASMAQRSGCGSARDGAGTIAPAWMMRGVLGASRCARCSLLSVKSCRDTRNQRGLALRPAVMRRLQYDSTV